MLLFPLKGKLCFFLGLGRTGSLFCDLILAILRFEPGVKLVGALTGEGSVFSSPALVGLGLLPSVFQSFIEILRLMLTLAPAFRAARGIILRNVQFSCLSAY